MAAFHGRAARVVMLHAHADASVSRDLERMFRVLQSQGTFGQWSRCQVADDDDMNAYLIARADVILLLVSAALLVHAGAMEVTLALRQGREREVRVILVVLRPCVLPAEFEVLTRLPRDSRPLSEWNDRDEALLHIVEGVQSAILYGPKASSGGFDVAATNSSVATGNPPSSIPVNRIFRTDGTPEITFVEPEQFENLREELCVLGRGLIVEGPSKVGKSTALKKALKQQQQPPAALWLDGKLLSAIEPDVQEVTRFDQALAGLVSGEFAGYLLIDDFHYVAENLKRRLALRMKALADQDEPRAKVTIIGINPVGHSLPQLVPDLAGRFHIVRMNRQPDAKLNELIVRGEQAAGVRFRQRDRIINEADGSFYIAQLLCYRLLRYPIPRKAEVAMLPSATRDIEAGPSDVMESIREDWHGRYYNLIRDFAAHDASPPPRGAGLVLLWLLAHSPNGDVSVQEALNRFPPVAPAIEWLSASNLRGFFEAHTSARELLYYNAAAGTLSIEDPQLKFFLRKLDWEQLARASGHVNVQFHPVDGPLFMAAAPSPPPPQAIEDAGGLASPARLFPPGVAAPAPSEVRVLHLSDLHIQTDDQAVRWYAQLAADLRQQGCERLDAVVISGDVTNQAAPAEYVAARQLLEQVLAGFGLGPRQLVIVPGNHDLNWHVSQEAYALHRRRSYTGPLVAGTYVEHGAGVVEVRDESAYKLRFRYFADFYRELKGEEFPLEYEQQGILVNLPEHGLRFLGLNSAWEIDHHFRDRAGIHPTALAHALVKLGPPGGTRIAVWHHPLQAATPDHIKEHGFLQQLAVAGFQIALHGHIHRSANQLYRYDMHPGGRRIEVVAGGTFGAPTHEWVPGYPLQYNLLRFLPSKIIVETRRREEVNGAWAPDARWPTGPGADPEPRYEISLAGTGATAHTAL